MRRLSSVVFLDDDTIPAICHQLARLYIYIERERKRERERVKEKTYWVAK